MNRHSSSANPTVSGHDHVSFFTSKNNFLKISPKEYHIFRGNYAYQPDWKENLQCFGLTIVHILITCIIYGIMGMFCCATSFYFRNRKTVYFVSIFFWLIEILKPGSLLRTNSIAFFMQICYCKIKYIFWKILCCQLTIYTKGKP